jgi:glycosyltransferase involved in cell wall biosynthesis
VKDYWDLYRGFDVLVMPRRYGGLCLPAIEAGGAGLGIVMLDCPPNYDYPVMPVKCHRAVDIDMKIGMVETYTADPSALAAALDHLADNPAEVAELQRMSRTYAQDMSWSQWRQNWHKRFEALTP